MLLWYFCTQKTSYEMLRSLVGSEMCIRGIYTADQDTRNVIELYSAPLDGSTAPVKLLTLIHI